MQISLLAGKMHENALFGKSQLSILTINVGKANIFVYYAFWVVLISSCGKERFGASHGQSEELGHTALHGFEACSQPSYCPSRCQGQQHVHHGGNLSVEIPCVDICWPVFIVQQQ